MAGVVVSSARVRSMLANRHTDPLALRSDLSSNVDVATLTEVDTYLDFDDLCALAARFKVTWAYLLVDADEEFPNLGHDNRTIANRAVPVSPELLTEFQAALRMLETADELFSDEGYETPVIRDSVIDPETYGIEMRGLLGITMDEQLACKKDEYASLRMWVEALHRRGIYVSQRRLHDRSTRAFSAVRDQQAVVVVDTGDSAYARIFSLLHEYCHIIRRSTGICDLDDHSAIERFCNAAAAAALLPAKRVLADVEPGVLHGLAEDVEVATLQHWSQLYGVSQAAFLIRLRELGRLTDADYEAIERRRRTRRAAPKKRGGTYYPPRINRVGRRYAHRVISSLDANRIDRTDASSLLEIGEHLLDNYRSELAAGDSLR